jgi:primosomal replication protein N
MYEILLNKFLSKVILKRTKLNQNPSGLTKCSVVLTYQV